MSRTPTMWPKMRCNGPRFVPSLVCKSPSVSIPKPPSLNAISAELVCMVFSWKSGEAWMVPFPTDRDEAQMLADEFKAVFAEESITKVAQNIKYDMLVLANYGIDVKGPLFDTMIAHYLLQPDMRHNLDLLAEGVPQLHKHINRKPYWQKRKKAEKYARCGARSVARLCL